MAINFLLWPLLIAALLVWWINHYFKKITDKHKHETNAQWSKNYFAGLNYLVNEQPDKAVDIFIRMLAVDSETVETHFTLGSLFRRRGEVDRAIRIHENLIARPQLEKSYRAQALLALGQDYMYGGMLDRAEKIFHELITMSNEHIQAGLTHLLNIYQQQQEWHQAIKIAKQLSDLTGQATHQAIAQYYCELAQAAFHENAITEAEKYIKRAIAMDSNCVRASLLRAQLEMKQENYAKAIQFYKQVQHQDPTYLSEILIPFTQCYCALNQEAELILYLKELLQQYPQMPIALTLIEQLERSGIAHQTTQVLIQQLLYRPSLYGVGKLLAWHVTQVEDGTQEKLQLCLQLINKLLINEMAYRCCNCGFSSKKLYWQCPTCKHWNSVKPIDGLEEKVNVTDII